MCSSDPPRHPHRLRLSTVLLLRREMQFFIDNLQYHLQVDVLDVQYATMITKIQQSKVSIAVGLLCGMWIMAWNVMSYHFIPFHFMLYNVM